jgi:hypothetical protein
MTQAFTARNWPIERAPARIDLRGDKTRRPEPAQHIIEFPGGAIELSRTTDGAYWAHIIVNRRDAVEDVGGLRSAIGEIVGSRITRTNKGAAAVREIDADEDVEQIAVLIRPVRPFDAEGGR